MCALAIYLNFLCVQSVVKKFEFFDKIKKNIPIIFSKLCYILSFFLYVHFVNYIFFIQNIMLWICEKFVTTMELFGQGI